VADLTAADVWSSTTPRRPTYYRNVSDIRFHDGSGPELRQGARFRFTILSFPVEAEVTEYEPPANGKPARVAWRGWVEGSPETVYSGRGAIGLLGEISVATRRWRNRLGRFTSAHPGSRRS
jgi:hypothetical protein